VRSSTQPAVGGALAGSGAPDTPAPRRAIDRDNADWEIMLRSLMVIWSLAAVFLLVVPLVSSPPVEIRTNLMRFAIVAVTVLGMLLAGRERLPRWTPDVCAYLLYLIVGGIISTYQDPDTPYAFLYLWLSVHSFYFQPWRRAAPQVAFIAADYAVSLLAMPGAEFPVLRWAVTVLTTVVICTMVALLRARVDALVGRLAGVARTDPLTGLRNRRAYDEIFEIEVARADRTDQPLSLIIGDIDHFKGVNDRFGHPTGDVVLRRVAAVLEQSERRVDAAIRLGGEEFALLLPGTDADGAFRVAQRVRENLRRAFHRDALPVTMSFGIASYPAHGGDPEALFQAADTALLAAKAQGRDRAVVCPPGYVPERNAGYMPERNAGYVPQPADLGSLPAEVGGTEELGLSSELRGRSVEDDPSLR
jgi:diguanylate cyclase (GGDEF)-like protein